jgi:hypothetical protein
MKFRSPFAKNKMTGELAPPATVTPVPPKMTTRAQGSVFSGRAFSGRGELRYTNAFLRFLVAILLIAQIPENYWWFLHSQRLADTQYVVFQTDQNGLTSAKGVSEFRTGPSDEEIRNRGWEVVRWIFGASSSDIDRCYAEASKMMTNELRNEFQAQFVNKVNDFKDLHVYKQLEQVRVRQLSPDMLPPGLKINLSRYDVVVTGVLDTYREGTETPVRLASGPFSYRVHLVPLDRRTIDNPYGVLVSSIAQIDLVDKAQTNQSQPAASSSAAQN